MLRWIKAARLALQHSPEREERLLSFASPVPNQPGNAENANPEQETRAFATENLALSERQLFHDAIFKAVLPDEQRKVLQEFRPQIEQHLGTIDVAASNKDLGEMVQLARMSIVDELNREERERGELAEAIKNIDTSDATDAQITQIFQDHRELIGKYFKIPPSFAPKNTMNLLQALLFKDIDRIRQREYERETGVKWSFLKSQEFEELYRKLNGIRVDDAESRIPNAFSHGNTMYFNAEHGDFNHPAYGETMSARAVAHETTHLAIQAAKEDKFKIDGWVNTLKSHPDWDKLKAAVEAVFATDPDYISKSPRKNERITEEALAIYVTNSHHPAPEEFASQESYKAQKAVRDILQGMFDKPHTGFLDTLRKDLEGRIDRFLEVKSREGTPESRPVGALLNDASREVLQQRRVAELAESQRIARAGDGTPTNPDEGKQLAAEDLAEAKNDANNPKNPAALLALRRKNGTMLEEVSKMYPSIRQKVSGEKIDAKAKEETLAIIDQNLEWISQSENDLILIERRVSAVESAEGRLKKGATVAEKRQMYAECVKDENNPYVNLTDNSSADDIAKADKQFEDDRKQVLDVAHEVLTQMGKMAERIKSGTEVKDDHQPTGASASGMMNWLRKNVWGPDSGIVWITPLNIMHIIKIYKEAIVENYRSNQSVKENRFAKNINFYTPIQHTLNKQARSTNEKETSEFKEYIEREGFTFDDVFGPDGRGLSSGLLHSNRHNFNRAKAVLQYAADHAWLYFMDRLHGRDVYGIDYEGIEGHQSFEELVAKHEAGKNHQIEHGVERVNLDPDVPPIMDAMVHELRHKNIFAVQGIMKRLQDKAKFSHSNTWMITTLLMLIRDECERDPTLKFCLDKGMIDNISNYTIQQSAWSITWLKMLRNDIDAWKKKPGKEGFGNNILTATMEKIEKRLKEAGADFPDTKEGRLAKYEAIAMVLSGKMLHDNSDDFRWPHIRKFGWKPGAKISLYENEFNDYREAFDQYTEQASSDPGKTDPDYFNVRNGGSDIQLLNLAQIVKILKFTSTAAFQEDEKARGFFSQVFARCRELAATDPAAHDNFVRDMSKKLSSWWKQEADPSRRKTFENKTGQLGENITENLILLNLVDDDVKREMNELRWNTTGLKQVGPAQFQTEDPKVIEKRKKDAEEAKRKQERDEERGAKREAQTFGQGEGI